MSDELDAAARRDRAPGARCSESSSGSTRIKACLVGDDPSTVLASGSFEWENQFVDGVWTYSLDAVWSGLRSGLRRPGRRGRRDGSMSRPPAFAAIGISAMMHGYLALRRGRRATRAVPHLAQHLDRRRGGRAHRAVRREHPAALVDRAPAPGGAGCRAARCAAAFSHDPGRVRALAGSPAGRARRRRRIRACSRSTPRPTTTTRELLARYDRLVAGSCAGASASRAASRGAACRAPAGELTAEGAALLDPTGASAAGHPLRAAGGRRGNRNGGDQRDRAPHRKRQRGHQHLRDGRSRAPAAAAPPRDRPGDDAGRAIPWRWCTATTGRANWRAWAGMFQRFAEAAGSPLDSGRGLRHPVPRGARGRARCRRGASPTTSSRASRSPDLTEGRPLFVRTPDSRLTLANTMRAQLYGVFANARPRNARARRRGRSDSTGCSRTAACSAPPGSLNAFSPALWMPRSRTSDTAGRGRSVGHGGARRVCGRRSRNRACTTTWTNGSSPRPNAHHRRPRSRRRRRVRRLPRPLPRRPRRRARRRSPPC